MRNVTGKFDRQGEDEKKIGVKKMGRYRDRYQMFFFEEAKKGGQTFSSYLNHM